jgi:hypothetical protein
MPPSGNLLMENILAASLRCQRHSSPSTEKMPLAAEDGQAGLQANLQGLGQGREFKTKHDAPWSRDAL